MKYHGVAALSTTPISVRRLLLFQRILLLKGIRHVYAMSQKHLTVFAASLTYKRAIVPLDFDTSAMVYLGQYIS
jgi:hypothetical protein